MNISPHYLTLDELTVNLDYLNERDELQVRVSSYAELEELTNLLEAYPKINSLIINIDSPVSELKKSYDHFENWLNEKKQINHLGLVEPRMREGQYAGGWEDAYLKPFLAHITSSAVRVLSLGWQHDVPEEFWNGYFVNSPIKNSLYIADVVIIPPSPYVPPASLANLNHELVSRLFNDMTVNPLDPQIIISCNAISNIMALNPQTRELAASLKDLSSAYQSLSIIEKLGSINFNDDDSLIEASNDLETAANLLNQGQVKVIKNAVESFKNEPDKLRNILRSLYKEFKVAAFGLQYNIFSKYAAENVFAQKGLALMFLNPLNNGEVHGDGWIHHAALAARYQFFMQEEARLEEFPISLKRLICYDEYENASNEIQQYTIKQLALKSQEVLLTEQSKTQRAGIYFARALLELDVMPNKGIEAVKQEENFEQYGSEIFASIVTAITYLNRALLLDSNLGGSIMAVLPRAQEKLQLLLSPKFPHFDPIYHNNLSTDNNKFIKAVTCVHERNYVEPQQDSELFCKAASLLATVELSEEKMPFVRKFLSVILNSIDINLSKLNNIKSSKLSENNFSQRVSLLNIDAKDFLSQAKSILVENFSPEISPYSSWTNVSDTSAETSPANLQPSSTNVNNNAAPQNTK